MREEHGSMKVSKHSEHQLIDYVDAFIPQSKC